MADDIQELDCVALIRDLPAENLLAGQMGAVVFVHDGAGAYEVEFPIEPRRSVVLTVQRKDLLKLRGLNPAGVAG